VTTTNDLKQHSKRADSIWINRGCDLFSTISYAITIVVVGELEHWCSMLARRQTSRL
jgi:hypothetical protein